MKKCQQSGQINFRPNSILSHSGTQQDILIKYPDKYKRLENGQIIKAER